MIGEGALLVLPLHIGGFPEEELVVALPASDLRAALHGLGASLARDGAGIDERETESASGALELPH